MPTRAVARLRNRTDISCGLKVLAGRRSALLEWSHQTDLTWLFWTKLCEKLSLERSFGYAEEAPALDD